jgi:hypothetical protein
MFLFHNRSAKILSFRLTTKQFTIFCTHTSQCEEHGERETAKRRKATFPFVFQSFFRNFAALIQKDTQHEEIHPTNQIEAATAVVQDWCHRAGVLHPVLSSRSPRCYCPSTLPQRVCCGPFCSEWRRLASTED